MAPNHIFNIERIVEQQKMCTPIYIIGIDKYDKRNMAYCLVMKTKEAQHALLAKTLHDEHDFDQEVGNISKYFNAKIVSQQ